MERRDLNSLLARLCQQEEQKKESGLAHFLPKKISKVPGFGQVTAIELTTKRSCEPCVLEKVQHAPILGPNLFSTGTATSRGFMIVEREHVCELQYPVKTIAVIEVRDRGVPEHSNMSNDEIMQQPMAASYEGETKLRCDGSGNSQVGSTNSSGGGAPHEELNKLALDFRPVSTSKTDKCRNFWIFIDSNPELGKIKYMGHRQIHFERRDELLIHRTSLAPVAGLEFQCVVQPSRILLKADSYCDDPTSGCVSRRIRFPSPQNSVHRRKWLNQLVEYKQLNLDRAAALGESSDTSVSKLVHNVAEGPSGLLSVGNLSQERPLLGLSVKLTPDLMYPLVGALPELPSVDSLTQCNVLSSDPVRVRCTSEPLVLADQVAEPPEALLKSLDGFDDQVKFPNPLQIYRAPVTLKNFLKKSQ
uniref:Uncharacterized protein n=1 Tax=Timema poppense TaxID=170557 RepID=A0A7R9DDQ9_TIMPO|nr:unnamed protein product [Timema poppensis]